MALLAVVLSETALGCRPSTNPESVESPIPQAEREKADSPPADLKALAEFLEDTFTRKRQTEAMQMLRAILSGMPTGPGTGWYAPSQSRYTWDWLADVHGLKYARHITKEQFHGNPDWFDRLDRDRDGRIVAADLDWSENNRYVQDYNLTYRLLERIDDQEDGTLTRDEWIALFDRANGGRRRATTVDLTELFLASQGSGTFPIDAHDPPSLLRALSRGELGSANEGPRVNAPAPDFQLKTHDGSRTIRLNDLRGAKPIVLVFGNYSCGPFRMIYSAIDALKQRYQEEAEFLAVYVREAHPSDGWQMASNARRGIKIAQPKTYEDRVTTAKLCRTALKCSMPLLVDTIDDHVGESYSGMPIRLYVIDRDGKVAYKGGRGPFGFKTGEMEQALLMTLIDQQMQATASNN